MAELPYGASGIADCQSMPMSDVADAIAILGRWDQRGWDLPVDADERRGGCSVIEAEQRKLGDEVARVVVHVHLR